MKMVDLSGAVFLQPSETGVNTANPTRLFLLPDPVLV